MRNRGKKQDSRAPIASREKGKKPSEKKGEKRVLYFQGQSGFESCPLPSNIHIEDRSRVTRNEYVKNGKNEYRYYYRSKAVQVAFDSTGEFLGEVILANNLKKRSSTTISFAYVTSKAEGKSIMEQARRYQIENGHPPADLKELQTWSAASKKTDHIVASPISTEGINADEFNEILKGLPPVVTPSTSKEESKEEEHNNYDSFFVPSVASPTTEEFVEYSIKTPPTPKLPITNEDLLPEIKLDGLSSQDIDQILSTSGIEPAKNQVDLDAPWETFLSSTPLPSPSIPPTAPQSPTAVKDVPEVPVEGESALQSLSMFAGAKNKKRSLDTTTQALDSAAKKNKDNLIL